MSEGRWRISVDRSRCLGTGICAGSRPDRFRLQDHRSWPVQDEVDPDQSVLDIAESCPTEAISVHEAGGKLLAPED